MENGLLELDLRNVFLNMSIQNIKHDGKERLLILSCISWEI